MFCVFCDVLVRRENQMRIFVDGVMERRVFFDTPYDLTGLEQHPSYIGAITDLSLIHI